MFVVGVLTALVACSIDITIELLAKIKYTLLREWTDHCVEEQYNCLYIPLFMWVALNVIPVTFGSFLVAFIEPVAGGSGIPQVDYCAIFFGIHLTFPQGQVLPERGEGAKSGEDQDVGLQGCWSCLFSSRWACCRQGGANDP